MNCALLTVIVLNFFVLVRGGPSHRIINGDKRDFEKYHAHLLIRINPLDETTFVGSGVLITYQHVLTTAFNVAKFTWWKVGLGSNDRQELQWHESTNAISHFGYISSTLQDNIAIIVLPLELEPSSTIIPAPLPSSPNEMEFPLTNQYGFVSGFGYTTLTGDFASILKIGYQQVTNIATCLDGFPYMEEFRDSIFCGSTAEDQHLGQGDQGAGFLLDIPLNSIVVGLASMWRYRNEVNQHDVYIRIAQYMGWIENITGPINRY